MSNLHGRASKIALAIVTISRTLWLTYDILDRGKAAVCSSKEGIIIRSTKVTAGGVNGNWPDY